MECGVGLAGARRHDQKHPVTPIGDGLDRGIDGVELVVARGLTATVVEIVLQDHLFCFIRKPLPGRVARPQVVRRREGIQRKVGLLLCAGSRAIVEDEAAAVRREDIGNVECFGIAQGLLNAVSDAVRAILGLDDGQGDIGLIVEDVVSALGFAARDQLTAHDDAALGEANLFADLRLQVPARRDQGGGNELGADVAFAEGGVAHSAIIGHAKRPRAPLAPLKSSPSAIGAT